MYVLEDSKVLGYIICSVFLIHFQLKKVLLALQLR